MQVNGFQSSRYPSTAWHRRRRRNGQGTQFTQECAALACWRQRLMRGMRHMRRASRWTLCRSCNTRSSECRRSLRMRVDVYIGWVPIDASVGGNNASRGTRVLLSALCCCAFTRNKCRYTLLSQHDHLLLRIKQKFYSGVAIGYGTCGIYRYMWYLYQLKSGCTRCCTDAAYHVS